jgi:hypothetical protein
MDKIISKKKISLQIFSFLFKKREKKNPYDEDDEYNIDNWPVPLTNEDSLEAIKPTHNVQRLPAYDVKGQLIHPLDYEEKLAGAIARVCFSIVHFTVKQRHIFNALVRDITIIRPSTTIATTSLKHILHPTKKRKLE